MVTWNVDPLLLPTRDLHGLRTMVERSSRSVPKLCVGEPAGGNHFERRRRSLGGGDRIAVLIAFEILVGKHPLAQRLAHVPLDVVGEHAQEDMRPDPYCLT